MNLEDGQVITLEDNKDYIVIKRITCDDLDYVYLMTAEKPIEVVIVKEEIINNEIFLNPITDQNELNLVISLFEGEN